MSILKFAKVNSADFGSTYSVGILRLAEGKSLRPQLDKLRLELTSLSVTQDAVQPSEFGRAAPASALVRRLRRSL